MIRRIFIRWRAERQRRREEREIAFRKSMGTPRVARAMWEREARAMLDGEQQ